MVAWCVLQHHVWAWKRIYPIFWSVFPYHVLYHTGLAIAGTLLIYFICRWVWPDPPPESLAPTNPRKDD